MMNRTLIVIIVTAGLALALRYPHLDERPLHNDEAVNAVKFGKLWNHRGYKYDPNEHHGPALYYAALALGRLTDAPDLSEYSTARLRAVTILFGVALILLLPLLRDGLGTSATKWAALFTAVSPAFVFYSRYFIHEMLLVFFALLALATGWRYWRTRKIGWILLAGAALGLMDATKETFVISLAAAGLAVFINQIWNRLIDASGEPVKATRLNPWHLVAGFAAWLVIAIVLFSSFFTNPAGPIDSLRSYSPWVNRAEGASPHIHPWYFYLHRLVFFHTSRGPVWTEGLFLLLAFIGAVAGFRRRLLADANASLVRFVALYAFLLTGFYSCIGYKTPWCLLNFWLPVILLAGVGSMVLLQKATARPGRIAMRAVLMAGAAHLAWQAWQQDTVYAAEPGNPYVYAQTSEDAMDLARAVDALGRVSPDGYNTVIKVMAPEEDYWPLPWYLRRFNHIGWWSKAPEDPYGPIVIISPRLEQLMDPAKAHLMGFYALRPNVRLALFVEPALWEKWLDSQRTPNNARASNAFGAKPE
jgi:uncharacterized protein (TIGR03663 family)